MKTDVICNVPVIRRRSKRRKNIYAEVIAQKKKSGDSTPDLQASTLSYLALVFYSEMEVLLGPNGD